MHNSIIFFISKSYYFLLFSFTPTYSILMRSAFKNKWFLISLNNLFYIYFCKFQDIIFVNIFLVSNLEHLILL